MEADDELSYVRRERDALQARYMQVEGGVYDTCLGCVSSI